MSESRIRSLKRTLNSLLVIDAELRDEEPELSTSPEGIAGFEDDYVRKGETVKSFRALATSYSSPFPRRTHRHMVEHYIVKLRIREIRYELMNLSKKRLVRVR